MTLVLLIVGYSGFYLCRSDLSVITPLLLKDFAARGIDTNAARQRIGWIVSMGTLAYALGKFIAGVVGDIGGGRRNFLTGMGGAVLFTVLFTLGGSGAVPIFTLAWIGNRLLQSFGWPGMMKIAGRTWPFESYGLVAAIISLSYLFGDAASREIMGWMLGMGLSWRGLFLVNAAILSVWFVVTLLLLREKPAAIGNREFPPAPGNVYAVSDFTVEDEPRRGMVALLKPLVTSPSFSTRVSAVTGDDAAARSIQQLDAHLLRGNAASERRAGGFQQCVVSAVGRRVSRAGRLAQ